MDGRKVRTKVGASKRPRLGTRVTSIDRRREKGPQFEFDETRARSGRFRPGVPVFT